MNAFRYLDIEHRKRWERINALQQYTYYHTPSEIREMFIEVSKLTFDCYDDLYGMFGYDELVVTRRDRFGIQVSDFMTGDRLDELWVSIPCIYGVGHNGVNCSLIDHLTGIGCIECAQLYRLPFDEHILTSL